MPELIGRYLDRARKLLSFVLGSSTEQKPRQVLLADELMLSLRMALLRDRSIGSIDEFQEQHQELEKLLYQEAQRRGKQLSEHEACEVIRSWCLKQAPGMRDHIVHVIFWYLKENPSRYRSELLRAYQDCTRV
jgi:hypothetical protein